MSDRFLIVSLVVTLIAYLAFLYALAEWGWLVSRWRLWRKRRARRGWIV
jgi:hypothetical protein